MLLTRTLGFVGAITVFGAASAFAQTGWTQIPRLQPDGRISPAMAFDSNRGVAVLFGGQTLVNNTYIPNGETWEWNGTDWVNRTGIGPAARYGHAMVYDSQRNVTVLFGGRLNSSTYSSETWEWDGASWTRRDIVGPTSRCFHAMAYDSDRHMTVLFGGSRLGGAINSQTWEYDGVSWTQRTGSFPSGRYLHAMAYDLDRHVTVLYGGYTGTSIGSSETWEWNGSVWSLRSAGSTGSGRAGHGLAFDSDRHRIVLTGGDTIAHPEKTWEWDGTSSWSMVSSTGSDSRYQTAMVYDTIHHKTLLFGGVVLATNDPPGDGILEWDGTTWTQHRSTPSARNGHAIAYDQARHTMLLVGGNVPSVGLIDTWSWDGQQWSLLSNGGPTVRYGHRLAYDSHRAVVVLFGGRNAAGVNYNDTWEWDGAAWSRRLVTGPSARSFHAMAFDSTRGVTVLTGGNTPSGGSNEVWEWNGSDWLQRGSSPIALRDHSMAYDSLRRRCVVFSSSPNGQYEYDGNSWIQVNASFLPPYETKSAMVYDSPHGQCLLFGGFPPGSLTWEWNGAAWSSFAGAHPADRFDFGMAYDSDRHVTFLFGGRLLPQALVDVADTWEYTAPCLQPVGASQPVSQTGCLHSSVSLTYSVSGDLPMAYQWRKNGVAIDGTSNSTALRMTLTLTHIGNSDAASYDCVATDSCGTATSDAAALTVCMADFNCDSIVDFFDYLDFVSAFAALSADADVNDDDVVDFFDYLDFVQGFAAGC